MTNSLAVQWLGLHTLTTEDLGSIPGRGTKIPQASLCGQKKKKTKKIKMVVTRGRGMEEQERCCLKVQTCNQLTNTTNLTGDLMHSIANIVNNIVL